MGCHQFTPFSNFTTLESNMSLEQKQEQVRYPGDDPTPDEAREAVQIAQEVRRWARAVLRPSSRQP